MATVHTRSLGYLRRMNWKGLLRVAIAALLLCSANSATAQAASSDARAKIITGQIVDETGKPIAGAAIGLYDATDHVDTNALLRSPSVTTDRDGSYSIAAATPLTDRRLILAASGRQSIALRVTASFVIQHGSLGQSVLPPGGQLIGRVRDEAGNALAGVRVRVSSAIANLWGRQADLCAGAVSNDQGIFRVPCVPRTGLKVTASKPGYAVIQRIVAQDTPLALTLHRTGLVRGRVVDGGGQPIKFAGLYLKSVADIPAAEALSQTAADGTFALTAPPLGVRYRVAAYENEGFSRSFSSGLLRGPQEDVVVTSWLAEAKALGEVTLLVCDARGDALAHFEVASISHSPLNLQALLRHTHPGSKHSNGRASLAVTSSQVQGFLVTAANHAFEVVALPREFTKPIAVVLAPESRIAGTVIDSTTNKPMAGVAVRALPVGPSFGVGRMPDTRWPRTDANGRYVVGGLRTGTYNVQAHVAGRIASPPTEAEVPASATATLDLSVPKRKAAKLRIAAAPPDGPHRQLTLSRIYRFVSTAGDFQHRLRYPAHIALCNPGVFEIGPLASNKLNLLVHIPSRTRAGTATRLHLKQLSYRDEPVQLDLPNLSSTIVRGRIVPSQAIPYERIAVMATCTRKQNAFINNASAHPTSAGVNSDGTFAIDLPAGSYALQLADSRTGIVFFTSPEDVLSTVDNLVLRPAVHWLDLQFAPKHAGELVVVPPVRVTLERQREGECSAFLHASMTRNRQQTGLINIAAGVPEQRWLMPAGELLLEVPDLFGVLKPWEPEWHDETVATARVDISKPTQTLRVELPPPPSDAEIMKR